MRTRLQLSLPMTLGTVLLAIHSVVCAVLYFVTLRNLELGLFWEHMRLTDLPVSVLLDVFFDSYTHVIGQTEESTYHAPYFWFHVVFGGMQSFFWGWLLGVMVRRLRYWRQHAQAK